MMEMSCRCRILGIFWDWRFQVIAVQKKKKIKTQLLPDNSLYYETRIVVTLGVAAKLRS